MISHLICVLVHRSLWGRRIWWSTFSLKWLPVGLYRLRAWGRGAEPTPAEIFGEAEVVEAEAEVCLERQKSVQKAKRRLDFCGPSQTTAEDESRSDCVSGVRGIKPPHCSVCRHVTGGESGKRIHFEGGCKQCGTTAGCHVARRRSRKRGRDDGDGEGEGEIACICGWCREVGWSLIS